ncbi:transposase [Bifidobacterium thermophilum RBL67]|uniref:Transposase n=1 Tax=Bifidobacterium thermophilum RBL67 TaxID=1254439 RepID=M4REN2_9BIFI|nr:transposase [Bifidobacterium thermophilum RBL67]
MCGHPMKKNGRTGKGVQRWECPACRLSSTMPQRERKQARALEVFVFT